MMSQSWRGVTWESPRWVCPGGRWPLGEVCLPPSVAPSQFEYWACLALQKEGILLCEGGHAFLHHLLTERCGFQPKLLQCAVDSGPCASDRSQKLKAVASPLGLDTGNASQVPLLGHLIEKA